MVELAASTTFQVGTNIALTVPAWIQMQLELPQLHVQTSNQQTGASEGKIETSVTLTMLLKNAKKHVKNVKSCRIYGHPILKNYSFSIACIHP